MKNGLIHEEKAKLRSEQIAAKALEAVDNDRYVLCNLVFARVEQLNGGELPLIEDVDLKIDKLPDIAMREIAEGKIKLDKIENIKK